MKVSLSHAPGAAAHLTYCTNIHPGESWSAVFENLQTYTAQLKQRLCQDRPFGIGLRLSNAASLDLMADGQLGMFKAWLRQQGLYVFTLNGFPYGGFHAQVVKDKVYAPDWTQPARLDYTLRLTEILAALLPDGVAGGISTLPLSYKPWHMAEGNQSKGELFAQVYEESVQQIVQVAAKMALLAQTRRNLHLDIEPEPDGLIENAAEMIAFFEEWLIPVGSRLLKAQGFSSPESILRQHVQVCYDTCHFAVEYEDPATVVSQFQQANIQIGKLQLSSAIKAPLPGLGRVEQRASLRSHLTPFAESTYLHQVIERHRDGHLQRYRDLSAALPFLEKTVAQEWRTHFHVPIFLDAYQTFSSTQDHIVEMLTLLPETGCCHLEIETYTWDVLPAELALDVVSAIEREYAWVLKNLGSPRPDTQPAVASLPV